MTNPKISVIVPVYNVRHYLPHCIDSILSQNFPNFELLLIDDGSKDSSGAICDEYAKKDSRIRVFHKENGGVSSARNLGLDNAKGEWLTFVDSDDWIEKNYLSTLLEGTICDLSICNCSIENSNIIFDSVIENGLQDKTAIENLLNNGKFTGYAFMGPYCKLFRKTIIDKHHIRYKENVSSGEDALFVLDYFCHINNYFGIDKNLYHYWQPGSGLSRKTNLIFNFIKFATEANFILINLSNKFNYDKDKFFVNLLKGGFNACLVYGFIESNFNKKQIKDFFSVFPYKYYRIYIQELGKLIKFSGFLYKHRYFGMFAIYLRLLKKINHPFFRTLG